MTKNRIQEGSVRTLIFQEGQDWFGTALEFNIVEAGTSPQEVMLLLDEAIRGYVESIHKNGISDAPLNQEVDPEYEALWNRGESKKEIRDDRVVYSAGLQPLAALAA